MPEIKKLSVLLILILLFSGCFFSQEKTPLEETSHEFSFRESPLFPFYCVGQDNMLWRIENNGSFSLNHKVNYSLGSGDQSFICYLREKDKIYFATDITVKNGVTLCSVFSAVGRETPQIFAQNVQLSSIRVSPNGDVLFIDEACVLFYMRNGIISKIEENVAQGEFVSESSFLFRLKNGKYNGTEFEYPIYSATADYRNYLTDALSIICADSENGKAYIIKNKHTVQKRASSVEVADCFVYADGEILFDISSVVLSQFENETKHTFLLSCSETSTVLKYDIYRIDSSEPVLKASNVISAKYISSSRDALAYEYKNQSEIITTVIFSDNRTVSLSLGKNVSLNNVYYQAPDLYVFSQNELFVVENNQLLSVFKGFESVYPCSSGLICFREASPPYSAYACINKNVTFLASNIASSSPVFDNGFLYFYTNESNDLSLSTLQGGYTAYISNVDVFIGFVFNGETVAAVKSDDKSLFLADKNGITDTKIKVKRFIKNKEVI